MMNFYLKMKNRIHIIAVCAAAFAMIVSLAGCKEKKSYAQLLTEENKAVNTFLANNIVVTSVPDDNRFEVGPEAPYYQLDEESNVFMQVLDPGSDTKVQDDELVYFRFTRWNLRLYAAAGELPEGSGNATNVALGAASFRYGNYTLTSSSQWGSGLQMPLKYLGMDCEVNLIIKSQYGVTSEMANVVPFLYNVRYYNAVSN